jgi:hypothetical protein
MKITNILAIVLLNVILFAPANAQNLDNLSLKKGLKLTGGVNLSNIFYTSNDSIKRRDPYQFIVSGNMNLNMFGYDMPFSFTYSNSQKSYTQPFNRLTFTPQYKWVKAYLGYTSMTFSPYTLAGYGFLGGGVDLSPKHWRISLMAGRLKKPIEYNPENTSAIPSFRRFGYGMKVGYDRGTSNISVNVFTAKDDVRSIKNLPPDGSLHPMQNLAFGFSGHTTLLTHIALDGEYSVSLLNGDLGIKTQKTDSTGAIQSTDPALSLQTSGTRIFDAYSGGIGYQSQLFGLMFRYERVAPGYQSLGGYYFNNDMQNITLAPNIRLFQGKLTLAGNAGIQHNNLNHSLASTTKRWVGAGNINYNPSTHWNYSFNYSNFSNYTKIKPQTDPFFHNDMDSLNFYQVTNSMNSSVSYNFGKKEAPHCLMLSASYQKMNEVSSSAQGSAGSGFVSANTSYSHLIPKPGLTVALTYNLNTSTAPGVRSVFHGPSLSLGKLFFNKELRTGFVSSYNLNTVNGKQESPLLSNGINISYSPKKPIAGGKHNLSFNTSFLQRFQSATQKYRSELTVNLVYGFTF